MKQILLFLLAMCQSVATMYGFEYTYEGKTVDYTVVSSNTCMTSEGGANSSLTGDVTLPAKPGGYTLVSIGEKSFSNCTGLTSIELPEGVVEIGARAFYNCSGLKSIKISSTVGLIGADAFYGCNALSKTEFDSLNTLCWITFANYYANPLTKSNRLFIDGEEIFELEIPPVTALKDFTFAGCSRLTSIVIPGTVTSVGDRTFNDCSIGLLKAAYPSTLDDSPFGPLSLDRTIRYPGSKKDPDMTVSEDGVIYKSDKSAIYFVPLSQQGEFVVPETVKTIGDKAFSYCTDLGSVIIGDSVETIGELAFSNCRALTSIYIPQMVTSIKTRAFKECSGLKSAIIGNSVTTIFNSAFYNCPALDSLVFGSSVRSIDRDAFGYCGLSEVVLPPSLQTISDGAFEYNTNLEKVIMGANINAIESQAFFRCPISELYITSQKAPRTSVNAFNAYDHQINPKSYFQIGANDTLIADYSASHWSVSDYTDMTVATDVVMNTRRIAARPGETVQLTATLKPDDVTLPMVFWHSTNPKIATVDNNGLVTVHAVTDSDEAVECKIIAETLYADGPIGEVEVFSSLSLSDIDNIIGDKVTDDIDYEAPFEIYNLSGVRMGVRSVDDLPAGIYIVRQGIKSTKIAVK
ncbi:MAG: leucine-rich repeat protein [Duncaniella sp.]|nr:leucine-rich repeat protein [Duncaniella sp.]